MQHSAYRNMLIMAVLSFITMYALMYAMVDTLGDVYANVNQAYMAGLMAAPMVLIELLLMGQMYPDRRLNAMIAGICLAAAAAFWLLIRQQGAVADVQFLRSMIPHHSGAILMCEQASLRDPDVTRLCQSIVASQRTEIGEMRAILDRLTH